MIQIQYAVDLIVPYVAKVGSHSNHLHPPEEFFEWLIGGNK